MQYLRRLGIRNYRSFGGKGILLDELGNFNVIIGKNNSGKSNVLRFIHHLFQRQRGSASLLNITDYYNNDPNNTIEYELGFETDFAPMQTLNNNGIFDKKAKLVDQKEEILDSFVRKAPEDEIRRISQNLFKSFSSDRQQSNNRLENNTSFNAYFTFPEVIYITETRQNIPLIELRKKLYKINNHGAAEAARMRPIKDALKKFLENLLGKKFEFQFPSGDQAIEIEFNDGQIIPFRSLGMGVQQIFITAVDIAAASNALVLFDEPELNLHPGLLRSLLALIATNDTNQYILTTHSNVLLDQNIDKKIYSIDLQEDSTSQVDDVSKVESTRSVLNNLGIRASEILQTNGIIWVEGPTDRLIINKWLQLLSCEYKEGLDFNYQFYGGTLLAHYTLDDDLEQFVNLLDINRNTFVVMDSDRTRRWVEGDLEPRKKRMIEECKKKSIGYWVTQGREIENYIPNNIWASLVGSEVKLGIYDEADKEFTQYSNKILGMSSLLQYLTKDDIANKHLISKLNELKETIEKWNN